MAYTLKYERRAAVASGLDFLAGAWLFVSCFVLQIQHVKLATASDFMVGMVIALISVYRFRNPAFHRGLSWITLAFGVWILFCPVICEFAWNETALINNVVLGLLVIILSAISATATAKFIPMPEPGIFHGK